MLSLSDVPFPGPEHWIGGLVEGIRGELIHAKSERSVWRVSEDGDVWYAKQGRGPKAREVAREAKWLERLRANGVSVPSVLGAGRVDGAFWLVMSPAAGRPLAELLPEAVRAYDHRRVRRLLDATTELLASLHGAGAHMPDFTVHHVFIQEGDHENDDCGATLIDVARADASMSGVGTAERAVDLAALLFGLPLGVSRADRLRVICDSSHRRADGLRALVRRVERELRRLALRTRWRHAHADVSGRLLAALDIDPAEAFDEIELGRNMKVVRTLPDRENRRFEADDGTTYFMKVYPPVASGFSQAMREVRAIQRLQAAGVPTCFVEAFGEDVDRGSFVVVRGCAGEPLDDFLRDAPTVAEKRELARASGELFARMRDAGLRHRDAYPCHLFVARRHAPGESPQFEMRLIDLTRAGRAPRPRGRWFVKDAAQFWHGMPRGVVTSTDAVRWLRAYFGVDRLGVGEKRFAKRVARKERRITARQERKASRAGR